jgi:hypothetical protein
MTPTEALAQAYHDRLGGTCDHSDGTDECGAFARTFLPTLPPGWRLCGPDGVTVCSDPDDHELADAVRRFTDAVTWVMEGGPDGEPSSVWNSHGYEAKGETLVAAILAALSADKEGRK